MCAEFFASFVLTFNVFFILQKYTLHFLNSFSFFFFFYSIFLQPFVYSVLSKITKTSNIYCLLNQLSEKNISLSLIIFFFSFEKKVVKYLLFIGDCNPFFLQTVDVMPLIFFSSLPNKLLD